MPLVLSVAALLTIAATVVSGRWPVADVLWNVVLAGFLVIQFRLWDDLNDINNDRISHPDRVLCRLAAHSHFQIVAMILFVLNSIALSLTKSLHTVTVFAVLNGTFLLWYRALRDWFGTFLHVHFVLTKYPVFAFLISGEPLSGRKASVVLMLTVVYGGACIYEFVHNRQPAK
jgi:hypothetical protein